MSQSLSNFYDFRLVLYFIFKEEGKKEEKRNLFITYFKLRHTTSRSRTDVTPWSRRTRSSSLESTFFSSAIATKSCSVLRGQPARRRAQAMLHLFSFIVWRTWSYRSCMVARLWVLTRMSAVCWCCCCDAGGSSCGAGWSLRRTSARSSAMTFFAFKRRFSRFFNDLVLVPHKVG